MFLVLGAYFDHLWVQNRSKYENLHYRGPLRVTYLFKSHQLCSFSFQLLQIRLRSLTLILYGMLVTKIKSPKDQRILKKLIQHSFLMEWVSLCIRKLDIYNKVKYSCTILVSVKRFWHLQLTFFLISSFGYFKIFFPIHNTT